MAMERFDDDLKIIAGLGDDPKRDDGLSTQGFKSIFDKAGLLIQDFINNKLIPYIEKQNVGLPLGGGKMEGPINMNGQKLSGLNAPTADDEPATKGYADNLAPDLTGYATEDYVGDAITNRTVNNFATTEEGYVADARLVKALYDSLFGNWIDVTNECSFNGASDMTITRAYYRHIGNITHVYVRLQNYKNAANNNAWVYLPDEVFARVSDGFMMPGSATFKHIVCVLRKNEKAVLIQHDIDLSSPGIGLDMNFIA